jgi:7-cyano-7-deazaguanine synthase
VFVNYGQPAAVHEAKAARALAHHLEVPLQEVAVGGLQACVGEIPGRNALFVHVALALAAGRPGAIVLGIHAGTGYRDCGPAFVRTMQDSLDFHSDGALRLHVPFIDLNKRQVFDIAVAQGIPLHLTRSCEAATEAPCGNCRSCRDVELLGASS